MKLTDKQIELIKTEANKEVNKLYPLLQQEIRGWYIPFILKAYKKVVKHAI